MVVEPQKPREMTMPEWRDYQMLVLSDLESLKDQTKEIKESLETLKENFHGNKTEIAVLKVKSSLWGSLGGSLTVGLYLFYEWITNTVKN